MSKSKVVRPQVTTERVKLSDVAKEAGVHYSTVSRVLSPGAKGKISKEVAEKVRSVARKMGYQPNSVAASMRTKATQTLGFIVHDLGDPIYPPILSGIEEALAPHGYSVLVGNTHYDLDVELEIVNRMASRQIDGIFLGTTRLNDPVVDRCLELGIPLISVLRESEQNEVSAVVSDCFGGMHLLTEHILKVGFKDIAVIHAPQDLSTGRQRLRGILTTLEKWGIVLPSYRMVSVSRMSVEEGRHQTRAILGAGARPPELIMCVNDLVAIGAVRACREAGLKVPQEISVSGYNDIPLMDMVDPPMTTVSMNLGNIGHASAKLMLEQIKAVDHLPRTIRIGSELKIRLSVGQPHRYLSET